MTILLMILKVIGCILAAVFLFVALMLLLVLFAPFHYRAEGSIRGSTVNGHARVSWLFRLINVHLVYDADGPDMYLRLFGIRKNLSKDEKSAGSEPSGSEQSESEQPVSEQFHTEQPEETKSAEVPEKEHLEEKNVRKMPPSIANFPEDDTTDHNKPAFPENSSYTTVDSGSEDEEFDSGEEETDLEADIEADVEADIEADIEAAPQTGQKTADADASANSANAHSSKKTDDCDGPGDDPPKLHKLHRKADSIASKINRIKANIDKWKRIFEDSSNKDAVRHIRNNIFSLLKSIMPGKLKLMGRYSAGSPDTTALIFGVLAMFPIGYQNRWQIEPDFETEGAYANIDLDIKGHFFIIRMLALMLGILFDRKCRRLYRIIKRNL